MDPRHLFVDERLTSENCVFCGSSATTRDHVPSKVFLDNPLPDDLPIVNACTQCNQSFSLDEEYLACLLEVVRCGSTNPENLSREKIRKSLTRNGKLAARLESCKLEVGDRLMWDPEMDRIKNVVIKLARGHAAYEVSAYNLGVPASITIQPFQVMSQSGRNSFENRGIGELDKCPELGTRAFFRVFATHDLAVHNSWVTVQPNIYRYSVEQSDLLIVRVVFLEYLACEIIWGDIDIDD